MTKSFGTALTAIAMIGAVAGCANPTSRARSASIFGGKVDTSNIGLATRAQAALRWATTASCHLARRACGRSSPNDAGFRGLLGNIYFAGGRFASAEAAYKDLLSLLPNQPQIVLKLALVQIAQGKSGEALALLEAARGGLDAADHGLALALAGQPSRPSRSSSPRPARPAPMPGSARIWPWPMPLAGDWTAARTVAAQDVPADQLDARIQQWMGFAKPARASDQVARLIGVTPAAADPGQPVRLALGHRHARWRPPRRSSCPAAEPEPVSAPRPPAPAPAPVEIAAAPAPEPADGRSRRPASGHRRRPRRRRSAPPPRRPRPPSRHSSPRAAGFSGGRHAAPTAFPAPARGKSIKAVVQLAAYDSRAYVADAWNRRQEVSGTCAANSPVTARSTARRAWSTAFRSRVSPARRSPRPVPALQARRRQLLRPLGRGRRAGRIASRLTPFSVEQVEAGHPDRDAHFDLKRDQRPLGIVGQRAVDLDAAIDRAGVHAPPRRARLVASARRSGRSAARYSPGASSKSSSSRSRWMRSIITTSAPSTASSIVRCPRYRRAAARAGPAKRTSAPSRGSKRAFERATRLCLMSPQIATLRPSIRPKLAADGQRVEQGLGRMLAGAVAGVDHRAVHDRGERARGAAFPRGG